MRRARGLARGAVGALSVALGAWSASAAAPPPGDRLEATLALAQPPEPSARELLFDFGLRNVGQGPLHLAAWSQDAWRVELRGDEILGCVDPWPEEPTGALELAPGAVHVWRVRCRVVTLPQHSPVRLISGTLTARAFYTNHAQPSWLLTQDRTHYWTGEVVSAPSSIEASAAPDEIEPPADRLPTEIRLGGCRIQAEVLRFYRYAVPSPVPLGGRMTAPPEPPRPGEKPKEQLADVLTMAVHVRNEGSRACELRHWQVLAHGPHGERLPLRPLHGPSPADWALPVAPGKRIDVQLGDPIGTSPLEPRESYRLTFSVEETHGGRGWLSLGRIRFSPPEENPVSAGAVWRDPRWP